MTTPSPPPRDLRFSQPRPVGDRSSLGGGHTEEIMMHNLTRLDWWLGLGLLVLGLFLHGIGPRYEWHAHPAATSRGAYARFDRWTGEASIRFYDPNDLRR